MCEGPWELQMIERSKNKHPKPAFPSSLLSSCSWRWDFPDSSNLETVSAALVPGALGWGRGDILIFRILLPRAVCSSGCLQPRSLLWPSCQVKLHLANCPAVCFVGSGPGRWSENLGTADFIYFSVSYKRILNILQIPWLARGISFPNLRSSLPFLLSFSPSPGHCCLNDESSCKESNISS